MARYSYYYHGPRSAANLLVPAIVEEKLTEAVCQVQVRSESRSNPRSQCLCEAVKIHEGCCGDY